MKQTSSGTFVAYMIAALLSGIAGSIYYTYRTPYIYGVLGETRGAELIGVIVASEQIPGLLSLITGPLADKVGRKRVLSLSLITPVLFLAIGYVDPRDIPFMTFAISLLGVVTSPAVSGVVMVLTKRGGKNYSLIMTFSSIGWALGGLFPHFLVTSFGPKSVFIVVCFLYLIASALLLIFYPNEPSSVHKNAISNKIPAIIKYVLSKTYLLSFSTVIANAGLSLFYSTMSIRIYGEVGNLLIYSVLLSTLTALAGALVRPISGLLVDRYNPVFIVELSILSYYALNTAIYYSRGYVSMILWILPIYPFRDTATNIALARRVELDYQSSVAGVATALNTLSGILILLLAKAFGRNMLHLYIAHLFLLSASLILVVIDQLQQGGKTKSHVQC